MSEPSRITEEREFLPLKYMGENILMDTGKTEQIIFEIMSKSMPGGIISGYAKEGFPLYFVNDQYLNLPPHNILRMKNIMRRQMDLESHIFIQMI